VVWAGDFNQNVLWDKASSPFNFRPFVNQLSEVGLNSVYHQTHGCDHGRELDPTFYLHHREERAYHIDYVFASRPLIEAGASAKFGRHEEWAGYSDHMPLFCSFANPADAG
jgi:endonuclease/exonuclease/phosphatase family metal-dependent hydrolase